jgi:hypothetical protein
MIGCKTTFRTAPEDILLHPNLGLYYNHFETARRGSPLPSGHPENINFPDMTSIRDLSIAFQWVYIVSAFASFLFFCYQKNKKRCKWEVLYVSLVSYFFLDSFSIHKFLKGPPPYSALMRLASPRARATRCSPARQPHARVSRVPLS